VALGEAMEQSENLGGTKLKVREPRQLEELLKRLFADYGGGSDGRRGQLRVSFPCEAWVEGEGLESAGITLRDISIAGVGFYCHRAIPVDQEVTITLEIDGRQVELSGKVAHCTGSVGMNKVGVVFDFED